MKKIIGILILIIIFGGIFTAIALSTGFLIALLIVVSAILITVFLGFAINLLD